MWRKILNISVWVLIVAYLGVSLAFTEGQLGERKIKYINVIVADSLKTGFINANDVIEQLRSKNFRITGLPADSINRDEIRKAVLAMHEIEDAKVFDTPEGILYIQIWQREPVMRVIGPHRSFYLDSKDKALDLSDKYSARVIMVTGTEDVEFARNELFALTELIRKDPVLDALIMQIHVHDDQTIELIPRVGDFRIYFGDTQNPGWKLTKLKAFYKEGLPKVGWNLYGSIDLRYSDQIVAKKRNHGQTGDNISD